MKLLAVNVDACSTSSVVRLNAINYGLIAQWLRHNKISCWIICNFQSAHSKWLWILVRESDGWGKEMRRYHIPHHECAIWRHRQLHKTCIFCFVWCFDLTVQKSLNVWMLYFNPCWQYSYLWITLGRNSQSIKYPRAAEDWNSCLTMTTEPVTLRFREASTSTVLWQLVRRNTKMG